MADVNHDLDPAEDARLAYGRSRRWAAMARAEWEREGSPFTILHQNGTEGVHPLWKALREAELLAGVLFRDEADAAEARMFGIVAPVEADG